MQRVKRSTAVAVKPSPPAGGTPGYFTGGDPAGGVPATIPGFEWFNGVQEELAYVIEQAGLVLSDADNTQLRAAIARLAARGVTTVTGVAGGTTRALTIADSGLVLVDAAAGPVTLNLPAATGNGGLRYDIVRVDTSTNAVAVAPNGTDTVAGAPSLSATASERLTLVGDGVSDWARTDVGAALNLGKATADAAEAVAGSVLSGAMLASGALVEYGSNANGGYWRFESGLQLCVRFASSTGSIAAAADYVTPFPAAFLNGRAACSWSMYDQLGVGQRDNAHFFCFTGTGAQNAANQWCLRNNSAIALSMIINLFAFGRWK